MFSGQKLSLERTYCQKCKHYKLNKWFIVYKFKTTFFYKQQHVYFDLFLFILILDILFFINLDLSTVRYIWKERWRAVHRSV